MNDEKNEDEIIFSMTLKDQFLMNDIDKFKNYGEFPSILFLAILLVLCISGSVINNSPR